MTSDDIRISLANCAVTSAFELRAIGQRLHEAASEPNTHSIEERARVDAVIQFMNASLYGLREIAGGVLEDLLPDTFKEIQQCQTTQ